MYCKHCGQPMEDFAQVCPSCGARQDDKPPVIDNGGFGWGLLGCCVPVAGLVLYLEGYKTQDRQSSRNRCAGLGGAGSPVLSVYHPIRSHLWGVLLKNDEMAIPVAAHHLWLSLPQRPLVLFSRQTVSSVCPLHRRADWNSSGSGGVLDIRSAGW